MGREHSRTSVRLIPVVVVGVAALVGCTNAPPPPLVTTPIASTSGNRPVNTAEVVVGVDSVVGGYNPHNIADQSAVTTALANLLLPSVFRPAPDGTPQLDRTLMVSAEVTKAEPYTVTYQIRPEASWSDNAPIAAEDFVYLRQQLREAPNGINAAGYRLISDITAQDAGKIVEVTFAKPYPGWRSLFTGLLPAHLLKDAPGGWANALQDSFPASGGPFSIKTLDRDRGEIVLERNDRYWEQPPTLDRIVLRRADQAGIVDALRAGHDQLALATTTAAGATLLADLGPVVSLHTVARSTVVSLLLRPVGEDLPALGVRQAVVAMLDRASLVTIGTGNGPAAKLAADAQVLAPSAPGYTPTVPTTLSPAKPDRAAAERLLTEARYTNSAGTWTRNGRPLSLVIAAPAEHESYVAVAKEIQRQLSASGADASVLTLPADELFGTRLANRQGGAANGDPVHLVVAPRPAGGDPATVLATNFGCLVNAEGPATTAPSVPASAIGLCDPAIQPTIDAALTGAVSLSDALSSVEPALWRQSVTVPLFQEADSLAIRPEVSGVTAGPPLAGPFVGAPEWRRSAG